ncbi:sigma-70 family RNA polymerase sigma factor [Gracilibacillus caseinilyticus]|uniref:Sigma-70 family RNA polymerase sigma factor n=1 Tax=Gracilibacillus caseinilyticus TaxID=2932256 RepID=A0ABY4EXJ6_9BACI|nr:sigma-70 family RNA polymerase sigma factor [Gracilibacillus caseinilyticus]UOQ48572.1 sigma-70 family RNA polymerase sigma factor [Gracilibacillus caseinilyticus]
MGEHEKSFVDENELRKIMHQYGTSILKLTYSYVKNWATAEDIVQETFITYSQKFYQFKGNSSLKTWLYKIAINKSKDFLKSPKNKLKYLNLTKLKLSSNMKSPDEEIAKNTEADLVAKCLYKVDIKYREVLILYYYEDLSIKEIVHLLSLSESNVKTRLNRGRKKFKIHYVKEVEDSGRKITGAKDVLE